MSELKNRHLVGGAAGACAACCAAPVIGGLGVAGLGATAVTVAFAGVVFGLVVGAFTLAAFLVRRSRPRGRPALRRKSRLGRWRSSSAPPGGQSEADRRSA